MQRSGCEVGEHLAAGTVEDGGGGDADQGFAVFFLEGFVDLELADDSDAALVGGWVGRIFGGEIDGEGDLPAQGIVSETGGFVIRFQGERAAGLGTGGGTALESDKPVVEEGER